MFGNVDLKKESFGTCEGHLDFDTWNCPKVHYNTELAWLIANHPETYMEASVEDIFGINRTKIHPNNNGYGLLPNPMKDTYGIYYNTAMCMHHSVANLVHDGFPEKISNIIEFESPGFITVHKYTGTKGSELAYESATIDLTTEEKAKDFWINKMNLSEETFDYNKIKSDITSFSYLDYRCTEAGEYQTNSASGITDHELTLYYRWGVVSKQSAIRNYINATGLLDPIYMWTLGDLGKGNYHDTITDDVKDLLENVSLEKVTQNDNGAEISPTIEEPEDGNMYIGPFKATFTGGIPVILLDGEETTWFTKKIDGTFEEQEKSLVSGQEFYLKIEEDKQNVESVKVNLNLNWKKYNSKILLSTNKTQKGQNIMYHAGEEEVGTETIEWNAELIRRVDVTIEKYDQNGKELPSSGMEFAVYKEEIDDNGNATRTYIGKMQTLTNTNKTTHVALRTDTKYIIKETCNLGYGYKNANISNAVIEGDTGEILSISNKEITFTVKENTVIKIENTPEYGALTINKTDTDTNEKLVGVKFAIYQAVSDTTGYIRLTNSEGTYISHITTKDNGVDISKYKMTNVTSVDEATQFITNNLGQIAINNLEIYSGVSTKYNYYICELANNLYGYNNMTITEATIENGTIVKTNEDTKEIQIKLGNDGENTVVNIKNQKELGNIEILKVSSKDEKILSDVEFIIEIGSGVYLQLEDENGDEVESIIGVVNINADNVTRKTEYRIEHVTDINHATKFITDSEGKVKINNLEIKSATGNYMYTIHETCNPNYGYGSSSNKTLTGTINEIPLNETAQIKITNQLDLGNLKLEKYDQDKTDIKLENVGFVIEISPAPEKAHAYLALSYEDENVIQKIKGMATINNQNRANADGKEYQVVYYCTDKTISEMSEEEKANITTFITENNGTIEVNNLEVYAPETSEKYMYKLVETGNSNYGFAGDSAELGNIALETNATVNKEIANKQVKTQISGYVWIENSAGKSNEYDGIYTEGNLSNDVKLTDIYLIKDGQVVKNEAATTPVEIKLRDKTTGEFIKIKPDKFDENGKYTFEGVLIEKLADYEVVFVYDGFYYTTVVENLDNENGSKVKEVASEREVLSNEFATVKDNNEIVATDGTVNTVEYYKDGHTSIVSEFKINTTVSANTSETSYNFKETFDEMKENSSSVIVGLDNINMGIVLREQPKISINSDIYSVLIDFDGYEYNYKYNGRQNYYENKNGDDIGVKFEQENTEKRYTRTVYASDIQAAKDQGKELTVAITYKIQIANESRTLSVMPKQLINYFDSRYSVKAIGLGMDESTHIITDAIEFGEAQNVEGHAEYKSTVINFNQTIGVNSPNVKDIYITFDVEEDAILDLLNNRSTYHNATEILSYASYYGEGTSKVGGKQYITDITEAGKIYAGIDKMSQPGNMEIALVDHSSGDGTQVLDSTNFEDDTTSAPSLLLEASESRRISGTVWHDTDADEADNQKLGNGIYDSEEKTIAGVTIELYNVDENGNVGEIATYSNGEPVVTTTNEAGSYIFGYYDEENKEYVGILPGKYIIKYVYNNKAYIVDASGNKNINVNDYKSTIITSEVIKQAISNEEITYNNITYPKGKWYLIEEANRYSEATDDIELRKTLDKDEVKYSTYQESELETYVMNAYTPVMDIGIEFTPEEEADVLSLNLVKEFKNVDFGIIEKPEVDITIKKQITGLEITTQNGANIIPKGNPSNPEEKMQYVKTGLDGVVPVEIESKLLQGAILNLEYSVTVTNNCQLDYLDDEYYLYGEIVNEENIRTPKIETVVDYADSSMILDLEKSGEGVWTKGTATQLYDDGLICEKTKKELETGEYHILVTENFNEVQPGESETVKLYATRYLAVSDMIVETNRTEILALTGGRTIEESIPGNYIPDNSGNYTSSDSDNKEPDTARVQFVITPPTGTTVNYIAYIIATIATVTILVSGIIIIKKKIIKKY